MTGTPAETEGLRRIVEAAAADRRSLAALITEPTVLSGVGGAVACFVTDADVYAEVKLLVRLTAVAAGRGPASHRRAKPGTAVVVHARFTDGTWAVNAPATSASVTERLVTERLRRLTADQLNREVARWLARFGDAQLRDAIGGRAVLHGLRPDRVSSPGAEPRSLACRVAAAGARNLRRAVAVLEVDRQARMFGWELADGCADGTQLRAVVRGALTPAPAASVSRVEP